MTSGGDVCAADHRRIVDYHFAWKHLKLLSTFLVSVYNEESAEFAKHRVFFELQQRHLINQQNYPYEMPLKVSIAKDWLHIFCNFYCKSFEYPPMNF